MASSLPTHYIAHLAVLLLLFFGVDCYDFVICLTRIQVDSYWSSSVFGIEPYAKIYVNSVEKLTTTYETTYETTLVQATYGDSEYCVGLDENEEYKVQLMEYNALGDTEYCTGSNYLRIDDVGSNPDSCVDSAGKTNYFDYYVYKVPAEVTMDGIEFTGTNAGYATGYSLSECQASCTGSSFCSYLSYVSGACTMFSAIDSAVQLNDDATSVSYGCGALVSHLASGVCSASMNTAECGWDDGDCCMATNSQIFSDDNCVDPRQQETTTTTSAPIQSVIINGVEFLGSAVATTTYDSGNLPACMTTCEGSAAGVCNYISYSLVGTTHTCKMFTSVTGVIANEVAYGVSYMCPNTQYLESGACSSSLNSADCGWDGGDCCMESNSQLINDDLCVDPRYHTTITTTASPTPAPSTGDSTSDLTVCKFILDNIDGMEFSQIGDGTCDTSSTALRYSYTLNGVGGITTVNDATCNWDGGDCCMATNSALSTNDYCLNPVYTTTTTATTTSAAESTSASARDQGNDANSNTLIAVVLVVTTATISFL